MDLKNIAKPNRPAIIKIGMSIFFVYIYMPKDMPFYISCAIYDVRCKTIKGFEE
jgi:hypothetical protein